MSFLCFLPFFDISEKSPNTTSKLTVSLFVSRDIRKVTCKTQISTKIQNHKTGNVFELVSFLYQKQNENSASFYQKLGKMTHGNKIQQ